MKDYSCRLAKEVSASRRNPLKFVLIGIGKDVNEAQMVELDDLDAGVDVDLWDHKLAAEMRVLQEIFAEVVEKNARVSDNGRILDPDGRVVKDYSDTGLPPFLEFEMPAGSNYFTLDVNGQRVNQVLADGVQIVPPIAAAPAPVAPPPPPPARVQAAPPPPPPIPPAPAPAKPSAPAVPTALPADSGEGDELWRGIDLEFNKEGAKQEEGPPDVELEEQKDEE